MKSTRNSGDAVVDIEEISSAEYPNPIQQNYTNDVTYPDTTAVVPWMIPRPSLVKNELEEITVDNLLKHSTVYPSNLFLALPTLPADKNKSFSSTTSSSSNASSKSANSDTCLLTAANLAAFKFDKIQPHHEYGPPNGKCYDTESLASSTHFTLVNGMERKVPKHMKPVECCCERHQLSILIISMTLFLAITIFLCIYFVHTKARDHVYWS